MALQWDFDKKAGTVTQIYDGKEWTYNFYEGNALMIVTYEFEENGEERYSMAWFFTGMDHARRCLGLKKLDDGTKNNMFGENGITRLVIYRQNCNQWPDIVELFSKAFPKIVIEILENEQGA